MSSAEQPGDEQPGDEQQLHELIDVLLDTADPATVGAEQFWGTQFDLGLAWVRFPVGMGGRGLPAALQEVVTERLTEARAPRNHLRNFVGIGSVASALVRFGTAWQQKRFLRPMFVCDEIWCQLYSEPGAGSDLANLATTAERDGDEWVLNGHKVWVTLAAEAKFAMLLARSHPELPKHRGITFFLVDMGAPGVDVEPLRQISGEAEFSQVFLHDVRVPDAMRVGDPGAGWQVAMAALMSERSHNGELAKRPRGMGPVAHAVRAWNATGGADVVRRDQVTRLWIEAEVIRLTSIRADHLRKSGNPGPEGSTAKLATGLLPQRVYELCLHLLGPRGMCISDYEMGHADRLFAGNMGDGTEHLDLVKAFLNARSATIGGGTTEMQKNTLAERVLGLPGEPRTDRDVAWSDQAGLSSGT